MVFPETWNPFSVSYFDHDEGGDWDRYKGKLLSVPERAITYISVSDLKINFISLLISM